MQLLVSLGKLVLAKLPNSGNLLSASGYEAACSNAAVATGKTCGYRYNTRGLENPERSLLRIAVLRFWGGTCIDCKGVGALLRLTDSQASSTRGPNNEVCAERLQARVFG